MNELNLQNSEFLNFVTYVWMHLPSGNLYVVLRTRVVSYTILELHYNDDILQSFQWWNHVGYELMSSFKDLEYHLDLVADWDNFILT